LDGCPINGRGCSIRGFPGHISYHCLLGEVEAAGHQRRRAQVPPFFRRHITVDVFGGRDKVGTDGCGALAKVLRAVTWETADNQGTAVKLSTRETIALEWARGLDRTPLGFVDDAAGVGVGSIGVVDQRRAEKWDEGVGNDGWPEFHSWITLAKCVNVGVVFVLKSGLLFCKVGEMKAHALVAQTVGMVVIDPHALWLVMAVSDGKVAVMPIGTTSPAHVAIPAILRSVSRSREVGYADCI